MEDPKVSSEGPDATESDMDASIESEEVIQKDDSRFLARYQCPTCLRIFHYGSKLHYEKHTKTCGKGDFLCSICKKNFCSSAVLKRHIATIHVKLKSFLCNICDKNFTTSFNFKRHMQRSHSLNDTEVHHCQHCSKKFRWKTSLSRHVIEKHCSGEKVAFECLCGRKFPNYHQSYMHKKSCENYIKNKKINATQVDESSVIDNIHQLERNDQGEVRTPIKGIISGNISGDVCFTKSDGTEQIPKGKHRCQFCGENFQERQILDDHVENCDPYDQAIAYLQSNTQRGERRVKLASHVAVIDNAMGTGQDCFEKEKVKSSPESTIDQTVISIDDSPIKSDKKQNALNKAIFSHKCTTDSLSVGNVEKETVEETQITQKDSEYIKTHDPDGHLEHDRSSNTIQMTRSKRKIKPKVFDDFETEYLGSYIPERKQPPKPSGNNSNQNVNIQSDNSKFVSQDSNYTPELENRDKLKAGERKGTSVTFLCPLCDNTEEDLEKIQKHIKENHDKERISWVVLSPEYGKMQDIQKDPAFNVKRGETKCPSCRIDWRTTKELKIHLNKCHAFYPFCCGICRLAYESREAAKLHMRKIHLKGHFCLFCPKVFQTEKTLIQHCNKIHTRTLAEIDNYVKVEGESELERNESKTKKNLNNMVIDTLPTNMQHESKQVDVHMEEFSNDDEIKKKQECEHLKISTDNGHANFGKQIVENSIVQKSSMKGRKSGDRDDTGVPLAHFKEQAYEHVKDKCDTQGEKAVDCHKKILTTQNKSLTVSVPVVIKSINIAPRQNFRDVSKSEAHVNNIETKWITGSPQRQIIEKPDIAEDNTECVDFDAILSDTDVDDDDLYEDSKSNCYGKKKKMARKKLKTQMLFDFTGLRNNVFKCSFEYCGDVFITFQGWLDHLHKHTERRKRPPFICMECSYSTLDKRILCQHLLIKHNNLNAVEIQMKYCEVFHIETNTPVKVVACVFCGFLNNFDEFSLQHNCIRKKLNFFCPFCPKKSNIFEILQEHIKENHADKTIHRPKMGDKYQSLRTSQHDPALSINSSDKTCTKCEKIFATSEELKNHVNEKHAVFPYSCGVCRQCYGRRSAVMDHMKKTHTLPFECQVCERGFGDKSDLSRHEASHQETRPFKCDLCESRYANQKGLGTHYRHKHPGNCDYRKTLQRADEDFEPEVFVCDICGLSFDSRIRYKKHTHTHKDVDRGETAKVKCDICAKELTKKAFNRHMCTKTFGGNEPAVVKGYSDTIKSVQDIFQNIKQNPTPGSGAKVRCGLCKKEFNRTKYMFSHIRQVHLPNEGRKRHCSICGAGFASKAQLISHMRSHTNVKPYRCRICSKTFRQLGHVKVHLLSHSKKANFQCRLCKQAFKSKCTLAIHVLTHCDIFPYKCFAGTCEKAFNSLPNLLFHVRKCVSSLGPTDKLECKICFRRIDNLKSGLSHMMWHGKDLLYKCNICSLDFKSYRKLYNHKDIADHFTQSELECSERKSCFIQTFKCVQVDEDIDTLQQLYDYTPGNEVIDVEMTNAHLDSEYGQNIDYTNVEETGMEQVIENDDLMDVAEQLTHMADREDNGSTWQQVHGDLHGYETPTDTYVSDNSIKSNTALNEGVSAFDTSILQNDVNEKSGTDKITKIKTEPKENNLVSMNNSSLATKEESALSYKILSNHPVIDESAVLVETNMPERKSVEKSLIRQSDTQYRIQESFVGEENTNQVETNVISEEMLASSKILDELGKEVKVNIVNDKGNHVPIQSNTDMLQQFLSTGKYTLQVHSSDSIVEEYPKPIFTLKENAIPTSELEVLSKLTNTEEFENLDFNLQAVTDVYVINEVPQVQESTYAFEIDPRFHNEEVNMKKREKRPRNKKIMNTDNVFGDIIDKDTKTSNSKMEDGHINYKVRLNYYEDRTKQKELYPLKCDSCPRRFRRMKDLNLHRKRHLPDDAKPFQCPACSKGYTTKHSYMAHLRTHTGERPHKCTHCEKSFRQLGHLQTHLRKHANYRPFKCRNCDKTFITNSQLKQHVLCHGTHFQHSVENGVACSVCQNTFANEKHLNIHKLKHLSLNAQNELIGDFNMLLPDKVINTKCGKVETKEKGRCMCDICGKMFKWPSDLNDHKAVHLSGPKIKCQTCESTFISEKRLQAHIKNVHAVEQWQCDTCGLNLKSQKSFKYHMRSHGDPRFQCSRCKKKFVKKYLFLQHLPRCLGNSFEQKIQNLTVQEQA